MRRFLCLITIVVLISGWSWIRRERPVIIIGNIKITKSEFNSAYQKSPQAKVSKLGKKDFLDLYITRKLILKQAESLGLDKDPDFLQDIQAFWEQALLKRFLARKIKELALKVKVNEQEIRKYYNKNKPKEFPDKSLPAVYQQIKLILLLQKQQAALQDWINSLKKSTEIYIDYRALGIKNGKSEEGQ